MKKLIFTITVFILSVTININEAEGQWVSIGPNANIISMSSNNNYIFAATESGIFRSSDNGNTWIFSDIGLQNSIIQSIAVKDNLVIIGTKFNGIFRSSDNGINWTQANTELNSYQILVLGINPNYIFAYCYPNRIFRSSNNGLNWMEINNGFNGIIYKFISNNSDLFINTTTGLFYSSNNGDNWRIAGINNQVLDVIHNGTFLFALTFNGISRSSDNGGNWTLLVNRNLSALESSGNNIFAAGWYDILFSNNNGDVWQKKNEGFSPQNPTIRDLSILGDYIFAININGNVRRRQISEITQALLNDVGVSNIIEPVPDEIKYSNCEPGFPINPKSKIFNFGLNSQQSLFDVNFEISLNGLTIYSDSKQVTLDVGEIDTVNFIAFSIPEIDTGIYTIKSWSVLLTDGNNFNDTASSIFSINGNPNFGGGLPSNMGYYFVNSSINASCAPDQPVFYWEDTTGSVSLISNGVNNLPLSGGNLDNGYFILSNIMPPLNKFQFNGICYDTFVVSTNGIIGLGGSTAGLTYPNPLIIPNDQVTGAAIYAFWYNLNFSSISITGRNLKYKVTNDKIIFTYDRVPSNLLPDNNDYVSFQVILETTAFCGLNNGIITVQYDNTKCGTTFLNKYKNNTLTAHTVGIQSEAGNGSIQYRFRPSWQTIITPGPVFMESPLALSFGPSENVLPVELASFTFFVNENNVTLNWQTNSETNNSGFNIERSSVKDQWNNMGFIKGSGNTNSATEYAFMDKDLVPGKYNYRLKQIDYNGSFEYLYLTSEVIIGVPEKYELLQNYPNPFNPVTNLEFGIPELGFVSLKVYDVLGKEVKTLVNEIKPAGRYRIEFDGNNFASGVYFYELRSGNFVSQKRMLLLK